jgi:predicted ester cyclase
MLHDLVCDERIADVQVTLAEGFVDQATNDGPYMGHPPSGRAFRVYVFDVMRIVGGRVVEHWASRIVRACSSSSARSLSHRGSPKKRSNVRSVR